MSIRRLATVSSALALSLIAQSAHASLILDVSQFGGGSAVVAPGNDLPGAPATVSLGQLSATAPGSVRFTVLGHDAGFRNSLWFGGSLRYTSGGEDAWTAVDGEVGTFAVGSGLLEFSMCASDGPLVDGDRCVRNDSASSLANQDSDGGRRVGFQSLSPTSWLAFFDDSGIYDDSDFDDLVVRIDFLPKVQDLPLPGALGLIGIGLAGLLAAPRRRRNR
jgi:hypothetical protein